MDLSQDRLRNESSLHPVVLSLPQFQGISVNHLTLLLSVNKERRVFYYFFAACCLRVHMGSSRRVIKYHTELDVNKKTIASTVVLS
jgi:hypothetical protein